MSCQNLCRTKHMRKWYSWPEFLFCVCICLCGFICVQVHESACMYSEVHLKCQKPSTFFLFLKEVSRLSWLGICLCSQPQGWDYRARYYAWLFVWVLGTKLSSWCYKASSSFPVQIFIWKMMPYSIHGKDTGIEHFWEIPYLKSCYLLNSETQTELDSKRYLCITDLRQQTF